MACLNSGLINAVTWSPGVFTSVAPGMTAARASGGPIAAATVTAAVERHHLAADASECSKDSSRTPVAGDIARESVNEDDGRPLAFDDVVDLDSR